jgi:hypothetical protein
MANCPNHEMKEAVVNARDWLRQAIDIATEDPEACEAWPALREAADGIGKALEHVEALLPMHPEIEAAIAAEWARDKGYDSPEAMGLGRQW